MRDICKKRGEFGCSLYGFQLFTTSEYVDDSYYEKVYEISPLCWNISWCHPSAILTATFRGEEGSAFNAAPQQYPELFLCR